MPILYIPKPPTLEGDVINLYYLSKTGGHLSMCQRWISIEQEKVYNGPQAVESISAIWK